MHGFATYTLVTTSKKKRLLTWIKALCEQILHFVLRSGGGIWPFLDLKTQIPGKNSNSSCLPTSWGASEQKNGATLWRHNNHKYNINSIMKYIQMTKQTYITQHTCQTFFDLSKWTLNQLSTSSTFFLWTANSAYRRERSILNNNAFTDYKNNMKWLGSR